MDDIYRNIEEYSSNRKRKILIVYDDMTIDDKIRDEKLQYNINGKAAKISVLSSSKIDKYEYLTGEKIILSKQRRVIEQAKLTYSLLFTQSC